MSDTSDPGGRRPRKRSGIVVALQIVLGILFLLPGACGGLYYFVGVSAWIDMGFQFPSGDFSGLFVVFGALSALLSIVALGVLMRFVRWSWAPQASLVLSLIAAAVVAGYVVMFGIEPATGLEHLAFAAIVIIALLIAAVPPFQHWWSRR